MLKEIRSTLCAFFSLINRSISANRYGGSLFTRSANSGFISSPSEQCTFKNFLDRTGHQHALGNVYPQVAACQMYLNFAADLSQAIRRNRSRACSRTAGKGFSAASLPNPNPQLVFAQDLNEFHVCPF